MQKFTISEQEINACFEGKEHQMDVLSALYRLVYDGSSSERPSFDDVATVQGWPQTNDNVSMYIMRKFADFDAVHHPEVINGGLWLNNGFSTLDNDDLGEWEVRPAPVKLISDVIRV